MFSELSNFNLNSCSEAELKAWVKQVIPIVIKFIQAGIRYVQADSIVSTPSPCHTCPKREICKEPCDALETLLPSENTGKGYKENTIGIRLEEFTNINLTDSCPEKKYTLIRDKLKTIERIRSTDIYENYKKCQHLFTEKQWQVITLSYDEGLTQKQIAEKTGKKRSSVSDLLKRAKNTKEKYERNLRAEMHSFLQNKNTE